MTSWRGKKSPMLIINVIYSLALPTLLGFLFLKIIFKRFPLPMPLIIGLSYGLGMGILAQWMLLMGICHIPYVKEIIEFPILVGVLLLFFYIYYF